MAEVKKQQRVGDAKRTVEPLQGQQHTSPNDIVEGCLSGGHPQTSNDLFRWAFTALESEILQVVTDQNMLTSIQRNANEIAASLWRGVDSLNDAKRDIALRRCGEIEREYDANVEAKRLEMERFVAECTKRTEELRTEKGARLHDLLEKAGMCRVAGYAFNDRDDRSVLCAMKTLEEWSLFSRSEVVFDSNPDGTTQDVLFESSGKGKNRSCQNKRPRFPLLEGDISRHLSS